MTVRELIKELEKCDQDASVTIPCATGDRKEVWLVTERADQQVLKDVELD